MFEGLIDFDSFRESIGLHVSQRRVKHHYTHFDDFNNVDRSITPIPISVPSCASIPSEESRSQNSLVPTVTLEIPSTLCSPPIGQSV